MPGDAGGAGFRTDFSMRGIRGIWDGWVASMTFAKHIQYLERSLVK